MIKLENWLYVSNYIPLLTNYMTGEPSLSMLGTEITLNGWDDTLWSDG